MWQLRRGIAREFHRRGLYRIGADPFGAIDKDLLFRRFSITLVFDVGANVGKYAQHLRHLGYRGRIISFEPASEPYAALASAARSDPLWDTHQLAVADADGSATLHLAPSSVANSLLGQPVGVVRGRETVQVRRLDSFVEELSEPDRVWVKLDIEGAELAAVAGGKSVLTRSDCVEIELTTRAGYKDEALFYDVAPALYALGFELIAVASAARAVSGRTLRFDALFARPD